MKELWMMENERIIEEYQDGEISLGDAGMRLEKQGFDPKEIREMLQELEIEKIPVGYFGKEKKSGVCSHARRNGLTKAG